MSVGATRFDIMRTLFAMGAGGNVESIVELEMEGEWTRIAETWSEEYSSDKYYNGSYIRHVYYFSTRRGLKEVMIQQ